MWKLIDLMFQVNYIGWSKKGFKLIAVCMLKIKNGKLRRFQFF